MAGIVLSDASPLIALGRLDGLAWLHGLFGSVVVPRIVQHEILDCGAWSGQDRLRAAFALGWLVPGDDVFGIMPCPIWTKARRRASDSVCNTAATPWS